MTHRIDATQYVGVKLACLALVVGLVMRWRATERTDLAAA